MVLCKNCEELQDDSNYYVFKKSGRYRQPCKECYKKEITDYHRSWEGLATKIYSTQRGNSRKRKHEAPNYTLKELRLWLKGNKELKKMHNDWIKSGFDRWLTPSLDRKDDYKPYTLDNIQLMTWKENSDKGLRERIQLINTKHLVGVSQYNLSGELINNFISRTEAAEKTGVCVTSITNSCLNKYGFLKNFAGGFIWKNKE